MGKAQVVTSSGVSGSTLLTLLFVGLKLTHYIDWRWVWVLSPVWIPCAFGLTIMLFALVVAVATGQVQIGGKKNTQIRG